MNYVFKVGDRVKALSNHMYNIKENNTYIVLQYHAHQNNSDWYIVNGDNSDEGIRINMCPTNFELLHIKEYDEPLFYGIKE